MSGLRRASATAIFAALLLGACSSGAPTAAPTPTSVPPALAFADPVEATFDDAGLWTEVASNDDLRACIAATADSDAASVEGLRSDVEALGESGHAVIADCLPGA